MKINEGFCLSFWWAKIIRFKKMTKKRNALEYQVEVEKQRSKALGQKVLDGGPPSKSEIWIKIRPFCKNFSISMNFSISWRGSEHLPQLSTGSAGMFHFGFGRYFVGAFCLKHIKLFHDRLLPIKCQRYFVLVNIKYVDKSPNQIFSQIKKSDFYWNKWSFKENQPWSRSIWDFPEICLLLSNFTAWKMLVSNCFTEGKQQNEVFTN